MSRLIDTDEIKRQWEIYGSLDVMDRILADVFPTADVVPVVRCRDCKHRMIASSEEGTHYHYCAKHDHAIDTDWFCADGEKVTE